MKRIFIILITVMMVAALLAGCGEQAATETTASYGDEMYAKYQSLIDCLENDDYNGAMMDLSARYDAAHPTEATTEPEWEPAFNLYGQWISLDKYAEEPVLHTMEIREDRTLTVDGEEYTWDPNQNITNKVYLEIRDGETSIGHFLIERDLDHNERPYLYTQLSFSDSGKFMTMYRMQELEPVEITMDNWQDYFEFTEEVTLNKNGFGEVTNVLVCGYFSPKTEYVLDLTDIAVEISYDHYYYGVAATFDLENATYELGEKLSSGKHYSNVYTFEHGRPRVQYSYSSKNFDEFTDFCENFQVERITGTLYLWHPAG